MKKVKVNKKYGVQFYNKIEERELEFPIYEFWKEDKSESYTVCVYRQILECIKRPTKEEREEYIKIYGQQRK